MLVAVCLGLSVPVIATFHEASVPLALRIYSAILLAVTAVRPAWGLLLLAGVLPLATPLRDLAGAPGSLGGNEAAELLVAPVLVAAGIRLAAGGDLPPSRLARPGILMAALVAASGCIQMFEAQLGTGRLAPYLAEVSRHLFSGYFEFSGSQPALHIVLAWIEVIALAVLTERMLRQSPLLGRPLLHAWLLGATGAAAFSAMRLAQISLHAPDPGHAFLYFLTHQRLGPLYADVNAVGSYFALCSVPAIWFAVRVRRAGPWGTSLLVVLALWLAGSRTALAAGVIGLAVTWLIDRQPAWRRALAVGVTAMALAYAATWNPGRVQASQGYAADVRIEMGRVGFQIAAGHPVFGAGVGLFRRASMAFITPDLVRTFPPAAAGENAHNNFIQVLAELGLSGLLAFCGILIVPLAGILRAWRQRTASWELAAMAGGLLAFFITCLSGHPLLIQQASYQCFFALGLTAGLLPAFAPAFAPASAPAFAPGGATARQDSAFAPGGATARQDSAFATARPAHSQKRGAIVARLALAAILASMPFRAREVQRTVSRNGLVYGASQPLIGADGATFRLAEERSSWFVPADAAVVVLPLRLAMPSEPPCRVEVALDGRRANEVEPGRDAWMPVDIILPPPAAGVRSRRIDLRVVGGNCWLMVGTVSPR